MVVSRWFAYAAATVLWFVPSAAAQSVWELTPYRIEVRVAFAPAPELTPHLQDELLADLVARAESLVGAAWEINAAPAPPALRPILTSAIENVTLESLPEELLQADKVMLLAVAPAVDGYRVAAREFDVATQLFGAPVWRPVWQSGKLRDVALWAMFEAFAPLGRIESVDKQQVTLRLKAAALPLRDQQLMLVTPGDVFRPVIRFHDRQGNLRQDRQGNLIRPKPIPWTFCTVRQITPRRVECRLQTGLRSPLSGRRRGRVQQLALAVVPPRGATTLTLQSRSKPRRVLAGYEVYAHPPDSKESELLGRTDRQGRIIVPPAARDAVPPAARDAVPPAARDAAPPAAGNTAPPAARDAVPPGESSLRILVARHGTELLARLPMVPGLQPACTAEIADDDRRLEVEGLVSGFREELVDLVTRREVLYARTRARIKAGKLDEAEELIGRLLRLRKAELELSRSLAAQQRGPQADDPGVQRKIDTLFSETQKLLKTHLHPQAIEQLRQEMRSARAAEGS